MLSFAQIFNSACLNDTLELSDHVCPSCILLDHIYYFIA